MRKTLLVLLTTAGLLMAGAKSGSKSYSVSIPEQCSVGANQLKPGDYQVRIEGSTAVFSGDRSNQKAEAPVSVVTAPKKFDRGEVILSKVTGGPPALTGIELAGTKLKLEFK